MPVPPSPPADGPAHMLATPLGAIRSRDDVQRLEHEARDHEAGRVRLECGPDCEPGTQVLAALVGAVRRLERDGTTVVLVSPSAAVAHTLGLCGLDGHVER